LSTSGLESTYADTVAEISRSPLPPLTAKNHDTPDLEEVQFQLLDKMSALPDEGTEADRLLLEEFGGFKLNGFPADTIGVPELTKSVTQPFLFYSKSNR